MTISDLAALVLVEEGYEHLTAERVAQRGGMRATTVRRAFPTRAALAIAAVTAELAPPPQPHLDDPPDDAMAQWTADVELRIAMTFHGLVALLAPATVDGEAVEEIHRRLVAPTRPALDVVAPGLRPDQRDRLVVTTWAAAARALGRSRGVRDDLTDRIVWFIEHPGEVVERR